MDSLGKKFTSQNNHVTTGERKAINKVKINVGPQSTGDGVIKIIQMLQNKLNHWQRKIIMNFLPLSNNSSLPTVAMSMS